ncbi:MAG: substrate-binding domain-containing protein [Alphaproteobacteria bacterium]|nr:substrate-binding domain-containing protein [Alphaproteobacteria bacterium]
MVCTQQELAEAVGFSRVTVSKALAGHPSVQTGTRNKIIIKARELGYRPSAAARAMRTGRCGAVSLVTGVHGIGSFVSLPMLRGIHRALSDRDVRMMFTEAPIEVLEDHGHIPKYIQELTVDGLLMNYTIDVPARLVQLLDHYRVPAVWLNLDLDHDAVYPDEEHGGRLATQYLLARGHRRIGYFNPWPPAHYSARARRSGYETVMAQAGLQPRSWIGEPGRQPDHRRMGLTTQMLTDPQRPTGLVCYEPRDAIRLSVACAQAGLTIGRDLSVVLIAPQPLVGIEMSFAHALIPFASVAEQAVQMLDEKIELNNGPTRPSRAVPYPPIVDGESPAI